MNLDVMIQLGAVCSMVQPQKGVKDSKVGLNIAVEQLSTRVGYFWKGRQTVISGGITRQEARYRYKQRLG